MNGYLKLTLTVSVTIIVCVFTHAHTKTYKEIHLDYSFVEMFSSLSNDYYISPCEWWTCRVVIRL